MKIVQGFAIIMAFFALGEACSILIGHFIPGSVIGMVLLFAALCLGWVQPDAIRPVAQFLTGNMILLFIPTFMGIIDTWGVLQSNLLAWFAVVTLTTVAVMAASGYSVQAIEWLRKRIPSANGKEEAQ
ncbi:MAG: CidA/LrgA family protein [Bacteroidales bacterium]|nr:CidA/LrgA family protein [Bacteroidales bacterium]